MFLRECGLNLLNPRLMHAMPIPIVRGAILIRVNSLVRGHSGVRWKVLQALLDFLNNGLVPCVPLRGSISASGDLSPVSSVYILYITI